MTKPAAISDDGRDEILGAFAHDLRIPVANILGFVDLLRDGAERTFSAEQLDFLARIEANCQSLLAMFEHLRELVDPLDS